MFFKKLSTETSTLLVIISIQSEFQSSKIVNQVLEVQRVPHRINPRTHTPRHILIKLSKIKYKENILGLPWWRSGWESAC